MNPAKAGSIPPRVTEDTICALATPAGPGGIAVIRVSGPQSLAIADATFRGKHLPSQRPGHTILHGYLHEPSRKPSAADRMIDEVLVSIFRAPRSYTGEDMVEISSHGGPAVADAILHLLAGQGARPSLPGEFTRRAVMNGKLDLTQAEAVLDLAEARSDAARARAIRQLTGVFSRHILELEKELQSLQSRLAAHLELGDELPAGETRKLNQALGRNADRLAATLRHAEAGPLLRQGALVAIVGRPNVGKSSLFNRLVGEERAIVTPTPGTTRDAIEAAVELKGIVVRLVDTAGWRTRAGRIEALGAARAKHYAQRADALMVVIDSSRPPTEMDAQIIRATEGKRRILVFNKSDCKPPALNHGLPSVNGTPCVRVSARSGQGIAALRTAVGRLFADVTRDTGFTANRRHIESLRRAHAALEAARKAPALDVRGSEVAAAIAALEEMLGQRTSEQVLDRVFSEFCIGK